MRRKRNGGKEGVSDVCKVASKKGRLAQNANAKTAAEASLAGFIIRWVM